MIIVISKISEDFQFDLLTNADDVKTITVEDKLNALEVMMVVLMVVLMVVMAVVMMMVTNIQYLPINCGVPILRISGQKMKQACSKPQRYSASK